MARKRRYASNVRTGGFLGIETKFYDTARVGAALITNTNAAGGEHDPATVNCISAPAQGDTEQNRDGNRIMIKSYHINGVITAPVVAQTSGSQGKEVFVALVLDKQTNGAQLNSEDVFTNPSGDAALTCHVQRNLQYSSRFEVLGQQVLTANNASVGSTGTSSYSLPFRFDGFRDIPVQFKGGATAAGVSGVADNSLHIIAWESGSNQDYTINYNSRVRFQG